MAVRWTAWVAELENLPPLAEEWSGGRAEEFARAVKRLAAAKRVERAAAKIAPRPVPHAWWACAGIAAGVFLLAAGLSRLSRRGRLHRY